MEKIPNLKLSIENEQRKSRQETWKKFYFW